MITLPFVVCSLAFLLTTAYIVWQRREAIVFLFFRIAVYFAGSLNVWYSWTQLLSPKNKRMPIPSDFTNIEQITEILKHLPYEYDPDIIKGINFDSIHHPRFSYWLAVTNKNLPPGQFLGKNGILQERKGGDCDDSASVWAATLYKNKEALGIEKVMFGVIQFNYSEGRAGHAVCLFKTKDGKYGNVGNWFGNVPQYVSTNESDGLKEFTKQAKGTYISGALLDVIKLHDDDRIVFGNARIIK